MVAETSLSLFDNTRRARAYRPGNTGTEAPFTFHKQLPGYRPTPLVRADGIASTLGVSAVWVKDESDRYGLPSFKVLGASWAVFRALAEHLSLERAPTSFGELGALIADRGLVLAAATDGNHGRAVARIAALLGVHADIYVPIGTAAARIASIQAEGASVRVVDGDYDDAVRASASAEGLNRLVISDTSWPGYMRVPKWIIEGYSTIHREVTEQMHAYHAQAPDVIAVQIGVGAFAASAVKHFRSRSYPRITLVGVEPLGADCLRASMAEGRLTTVPGPHRSIMAGLNCGTPSPVAWPFARQGIHVFAAIDDDASRDAMVLLAGEGIVAGESGAAGLAGLIRMQNARARSVPLNPSTKILVFATEGATNPESYRAIVGQSPKQVLRNREAREAEASRRPRP